MKIDRNDLLNFLNVSLSFAIDNKDNGLESLFDKAIDNNKENFVAFFSELKNVQSILKEDLKFFMDSDPAATSLDEIKLAYPGFKTIAIYRISHIIYKLGYKVHARFFSEIGHSMTGIDIHPAAEIDYPFFIDHGTGIVIGETAILGHHVKLYQGVTIGAKSFENDENGNPIKGGKRHPDIGNNVIVYANATILGGNTKIGDNCIIGGNAWITSSVEDNQTVYKD